MQRRSGSADGFTLIEVIVAMGILTIGILAIIPALLYNVRSNTFARNRGIATDLAKAQLEGIKAWPLYDNYGTALGVYPANSTLFGSNVIQVGHTKTSFTVNTSMLRNISTCGEAILFGSNANGLTKNLDESGALNTGNVDHGSGCSEGAYEGEDFKSVGVTVTWVDQFGPHALHRHGYVKTH